MFVYKGNNLTTPVNLELVRIDETVQVIEKYFFEDCLKLKHVHFGQGLKEVGESAFANCVSLESIRLPSTVRIIQKAAFYNCKNLKYVMLNEGLEVIEKDAFSGCGMEVLWLSSTVTHVNTGAFDYCQALKRVLLNEGLIKVENYAFNQCDMLESIEIPSALDASAILETFAVPEKTAKVALKDVQFWNDIQKRYEQEESIRKAKYGILVEEDSKMSAHPTSLASPRKKPRVSHKATTASLHAQEPKERIEQKLVEKEQHIEWLQKLLASAQRERDELQAKLSAYNMSSPVQK